VKKSKNYKKKSRAYGGRQTLFSRRLRGQEKKRRAGVSSAGIRVFCSKTTWGGEGGGGLGGGGGG